MSDEGQTLAFPLQNTLESKSAVDELDKLIKEYQVEKIIIGLPVSLSGAETESTKKTKKFRTAI
jgi:RNase H-fold protein (predicted Holliday junction resolvase)